jgi:Ca2+-transporting ATPase
VLAEGTSTGSPHLGLSSERARELLREHGPNALGQRRVSPWEILGRQARGTIFWLLVLAAVLSAALGQLVDAAAMSCILLLNAAVAFAEELHSEKALEALRAAAERRARVRRTGRAVRVRSSEVVPGDLLLLEPGDVVAADARIVEGRGLLVGEAELSGRVRPVSKRLVADRPESTDGLVLTGSVVLAGSASAEVVATGRRTELGKLARLAASGEPLTPLRKKLDALGRTLVVVCVGIVVVVAVERLARGAAFGHVVIAGLSLAVASLPESLGAMVTVALTAAARSLSKDAILVRRLDAVETLGSTTLMCVGKSGTLTTAELTVKAIEAPSRNELLAAAVASTLETRSRDPVRRAIVESREEATGEGPLTGDASLPVQETFTGEDGALEAVRRNGVWYVRGTPELVLARSNGAAASTASPAKADLAAAAKSMHRRGLWVQAVARGSSMSGSLECLGLIGLSETARSETRHAIAAVRKAGIRIAMMTGDHEREARAIALEVGLLSGSPHGASAMLFADTTPEQKIERVREWKADGEIVAVIGDRMNDAPAVREAHVGIAMGTPASDVTYDAADLVLLDDDVSHLSAAIERGRGIHRSLEKSLVYVLAGNLAELGVMLVASTVGWPEPLLPLQLLWINLLTDSLPALALAIDPPAPDVLQEPPRRPGTPLLGGRDWTMIVIVGLVQTALALGAFRIVASSGELARARSVALSIVVFGELFWAFALTHPRKNPALASVVFGSALLHAGLALVPAHEALGRVLHLGISDLAVSFSIGLVPLVLVRTHALLAGRNPRPLERTNGASTVDPESSSDPRT